MNEDVIASVGSLAISRDTLRAFAKGQLDEATEQQVLALLDTRPDLAAQVAAISSDSILAKMKTQGQLAASKSLSSQLTSAIQEKSGSQSLLETPPELTQLTDYKILKEIGRGGMGVVYLAEHLLTGRKEVLKVLNERLMTNPEARKRFDQEIKCIAAMNHETIVRCYTVQQLPHAFVLCMEYVPGTNLHQFIHTNGPLPIHIACGIAAEVCRGLQHAMDHGLVHRDIKPSNIMLYKADGKSKAKILDFGLARLNTREKSKGLTDDGTLLGTLEYISPEQCLNAAAADIRSDIYSLGCTLYHMLAGHPPFSGSTGELILAHAQVLPPTINLIRPEIPNELAGVLSKMLAKQSNRRYSTPRDVISDLQPFVQRRKQKTKLQETPSRESSGKDSPPPANHSIDTHVDLAELQPTPVPVPPSPPVSAIRDNDQPHNFKNVVNGEAENELNIPLILSPRLTTKPKRYRRFPKNIWLGTAIPIFTLVGFLAIGTLLVRTKHATITFDGLPQDSQIEIDGEVVTANWDGRQAIVHVQPGTRQVQVTTNGVTVVGDTVKLDTRDNKVITISAQVVSAAQANDEPSTVAGTDDETSPKNQDPKTTANVRPTAAIVPFSQKSASQLQQDWASFLNVPVAFTDQRGISFRLIPPGEFLMGSTQSEVDQSISLAFANEEWASYILSEMPQRKVAITKPFYLATTEVTQLQFESACSYNPSRYTLTGSDADRLKNIDTSELPVERVSRAEAIEFCTRLNKYYNFYNPKYNPTRHRFQPGYRLPSEAEWEFACQAGSDQWFWTGDSPNTIAQAENLDKTVGLPRPVGQTSANPFGLFDMHGNVREHVADFFEANHDSTPKSSGLSVDPLVQPTADSTHSVVKGGDYYFTPMIGRAASRFAVPSDKPSNYTIGFRVAMSIETYKALNAWKPPNGIDRFVEIHGASKPEFESWLEGLGSEMIPVSVNLRHGSSKPILDAVAVTNAPGNHWQWDMMADDKEAGGNYARMRSRYQAHWKLVYPQYDATPMLCSNAVLWRQKGLNGWATWNIGKAAPGPRLASYARDSNIPVSICVVHSGGTHNTHIKIVRRPGIGNRGIARLTLEQLESQIELCKKQNWRPSMLQIHAGGPETHFAAVFRENSANQEWAFSSNLSTDQLEQELVARNDEGFYPGGLASYIVEEEPRYVVIWFDKSINPIP